MKDLRREFASSTGHPTLTTELEDPVSMVHGLFHHAGLQEEAERFVRVESLFKPLQGDDWDEEWDYRCAHGDIGEVRDYLTAGLAFLERISDAQGNLREPYRSRLKALDREDLWNCGFFYLRQEGQVRPREFVGAVEEFIRFLDEVVAGGGDLLRRMAD